MTLFEKVWSNFIKLRHNDAAFSDKFGDQQLLLETYKINERLFELVERSIVHEIVVAPTPSFQYQSDEGSVPMLGHIITHRLSCKKSATTMNKGTELFQWVNRDIQSNAKASSVVFYTPAMLIDNRGENSQYYVRFVTLDHKIKMTR